MTYVIAVKDALRQRFDLIKDIRLSLVWGEDSIECKGRDDVPRKTLGIQSGLGQDDLPRLLSIIREGDIRQRRTRCIAAWICPSILMRQSRPDPDKDSDVS